MKKFLAILSASLITFSAAHAALLFTPIGPVTFKLDEITSTTSFQQVGSKTNQSNTATNITQMYKATTTTVSFAGDDMLSLLENSFNTNFPSGSQIGMKFGTLAVVDHTGTNVIFTPSAVVSFQFDADFLSGTETVVNSQKPSGAQTSGNLSESLISVATMTYDDTSNTTADGTHTQFAFKGFYTIKISENLKTRVVKTTSQFQGAGGGPVRNVGTILTGTISGKATGVQPEL